MYVCLKRERGRGRGIWEGCDVVVDGMDSKIGKIDRKEETLNQNQKQWWTTRCRRRPISICIDGAFTIVHNRKREVLW